MHHDSVIFLITESYNCFGSWTPSRAYWNWTLHTEKLSSAPEMCHLCAVLGHSQIPECLPTPRALWTQGGTFPRVPASQELTRNSMASPPQSPGLVLASRTLCLAWCVWIQFQRIQFGLSHSTAGTRGTATNTGLDPCGQHSRGAAQVLWRCHTSGILGVEPTSALGARVLHQVRTPAQLSKGECGCYRITRGPTGW